MDGAPLLRPETRQAAVTNQVGTLTKPKRWPSLPAPRSSDDWFVDISKSLTVVSMSNTALEGCNGQVTKDTRDALYADLAALDMRGGEGDRSA